MSDAKTLFSLSLRDEASKQLKQFEGNYKKTIGDVEGADGGIGAGWSDKLAGTLPQLAMGATIAGIAAASWQLGELGATTLRVRDSFGAMADNSGISSDALLQSMRAATSGTVADSELMLAANRALMLGVATNAEDLSGLMAAAIERGSALGVSASQAVSDIITGIGRMSPEILDNLGIVGAAKSVEAYAATLGTTADKLTDVQKKAALVRAVIESSPSGGGVINDAAASFERLNASLQNAKEELGVMFAPMTAAMAQALADGVSVLTDGIAGAQAAGVTNAGTEIGFVLGRAIGQAAQAETGNWLRDLNRVAALPATLPYELVNAAPGFVAGVKEGAGTAFEKNAGPDILPEKLKAAREEYQRIADDIASAKESIATFDQEGNKVLAASGRQSLAELNIELKNASMNLAVVSAAFGAVQGPIREGEAAVWGANMAWDGFKATVSTTGAAVATADPEMLKLASSLGLIGQMALAAATDVASFKVEVTRLQGIASSIKSTRDAGISSAISLGQRAIDLGADPEVVTAMVDRAANSIDGMILATNGSAVAQLNNKVAVDDNLDSLKNLTTGLEASNSAAEKYASGGLKAINDRFDGISSKVGSVISGAMDLGVTWPGSDGKDTSGDAINENAKRLAAIANEGLIGQSWMPEFQAEAPNTYADLMSKIAGGMDAQGAAQQLMREFQAGLRPELLDREMIKDRVRQMLLGESNASALAQEIAAELATEMGVSMPDALQAAQGALGVKSNTGTTDQFGTGFTDNVDGGSIASGSLAKIAKAFLDNESNVRKSGGLVGAWWGEGFMVTVGDNVPPGLLEMLTGKLLPGILAAIARSKSTTGTSDAP